MRYITELCRILVVLWTARRVQDYLWDVPGKRLPGQRHEQSYDEWVCIIEKRISKLREVDRTRLLWYVEAKKRSLQVATVAVALMEYLDEGGE